MAAGKGVRGARSLREVAFRRSEHQTAGQCSEHETRAGAKTKHPAAQPVEKAESRALDEFLEKIGSDADQNQHCLLYTSDAADE